MDGADIIKKVTEFTKQMFAMAAYCGMKDRKEFHIVQFFPPFLNPYPIWLEYAKGQKEFLRLLADEDEYTLKDDLLGDSTYPRTFPKDRENYPLASPWIAPFTR